MPVHTLWIFVVGRRNAYNLTLVPRVQTDDNARKACLTRSNPHRDHAPPVARIWNDPPVAILSFPGAGPRRVAVASRGPPVPIPRCHFQLRRRGADGAAGGAVGGPRPPGRRVRRRRGRTLDQENHGERRQITLLSNFSANFPEVPSPNAPRGRTSPGVVAACARCCNLYLTPRGPLTQVDIGASSSCDLESNSRSCVVLYSGLRCFFPSRVCAI